MNTPDSAPPTHADSSAHRPLSSGSPDASAGAAEQAQAYADRYGAPRRGLSPRTRKWAVIAALGLSVLTAAWFTVTMAFGQLEYKDVGYSVVSDTRATVDFEVTKDFDATAQCMIQVLDSSYAVVGSRIVTVGPHEGATAADRSQYLTTELRTEHRGVSGIVDQCWLLDS